jgi:hypothetical protein
MGSGAFLRFLLEGEITSLLAWLAGALFIPSLALTLGVLTGSSETLKSFMSSGCTSSFKKFPARLCGCGSWKPLVPLRPAGAGLTCAGSLCSPAAIDSQESLNNSQSQLTASERVDA